MRIPLRVALLGSFLILVLSLTGAQIWVLNLGLRTEFLSIQERELRRELELAPVFLESLGPISADSAAVALSRRVGFPVTFLDLDGRVVGASSDLPFQIRGLVVSRESPELARALEGEVGFSRRRGVDEVEIRLFSAVRVRFEGRDLLLQVAVPMDEVNRAVRSRIRYSMLLLIPALLLSAAFTLLLGGAVVRPLETLGRRARGVAGGNFVRRVPRTIRIQELDDLAGTFNRMSEELQTQVGTMVVERDEMQALIDCMGEAVIALGEDARVLHTNRAAIELLDFPKSVDYAPIGTLVRQPVLRSLLESAVVRPFAAKEVTHGDRHLIVSARAVEGGGTVVTFLDVTEIRRLEMVRRDFVANASHEMKTPLTSMRGFAETLIDDDPPEETRKEFLELIRVNAVRLQNLVDDLLDLSRLESGGWVAKVADVELGPLVWDIWADYEQKAQEEGVDFAVEGDATVRADEQGLTQVLKNLMDNSLRYTARGGSISVRFLREGSETVVSLQDTGTGIPTSALSRIFERFFRVDPARSRADGGTGLGLAIVRHLVQAMGGEVWAESELGKGTTIFFTVPSAPGRKAEP